MASLVLTQVPVAVSINSGTSLTRSAFKKNNVFFQNKRTSGLSSDSKILNPRLKNRFVVRMSAQQPVNPEKVLVSPWSLEDATEPPQDLYDITNVFKGTVVSNEIITGPGAATPVHHIVIDHGGKFPYWEGQTYGVLIPAAEDIREYSLATSRYGDCFDGKTTSLCVKRQGAGGIYLCDTKPGDKVPLVGPYRKEMILPRGAQNINHIMVATSTGVAPFRGNLRRMFKEVIPTFQFNSLAWLFVGVANQDSLLYNNEFIGYLEEYPGNFRYHTAFSEDQKNKKGGKMYVQDIFDDHSDEVLELLCNGAYIYFCGLKGMMPDCEAALRRAAERHHKDWDKLLSKLKLNNQWRVEVY